MADNIPEGEITSRLKRTDEDLENLQRSVKTGMVNVKILMEFRQAIDHARQSTAAMQDWLEEQDRTGGEPYKLLPKVMTERMRIVPQLGRDVAPDIDRGSLAFDNEGLFALHPPGRTCSVRW